MKTPRAIAEDICRELGMLRRFGDSENVPPVERVIAARDAEHSRRTELAREVLREFGVWRDDHCGICGAEFKFCDAQHAAGGRCIGARARAALESLEEK